MVQIQVNSRRRIPSSVLKGQRPSYKSVHTLFVNVCVQEYLRRMYESYWERSHLDTVPDMTGNSPQTGREDDLGNSWEQLRPTTYHIKQQLYKQGGIGSYVNQRRSRAAVATARRIQGVEPLSGDGINIRTGQLLAATFPGPIINGRLVKTKDQNVTVKGTGIHFDTNNVAHSEAVESGKRPIVPDDETAASWMQEAVDIALDQAEIEYHRIRERMKERSRRRRQKR